jgi:hypothetical protein
MRDRPQQAARLLGALPYPLAQSRKPSADLSGKLPPAYDQGFLNSCTACAIAGAVQFARRANGKAGDFILSQLFIYYQERKTEGHIYLDVGSGLLAGINSVSYVGVCPDSE